MEITRAAMTFAVGKYHKVYLYIDIAGDLTYPYAVPQRLKGDSATFNLLKEKPQGDAVKLMITPGVSTAKRYTTAFAERKYWGVEFKDDISAEPVDIVSVVDVGDELELQVRLTPDHMASMVAISSEFPVRNPTPTTKAPEAETPKAEVVEEPVKNERQEQRQEEPVPEYKAKKVGNSDRTIMKVEIIRNLLEIMEYNELRELRIPNSNITIEA